MMTVVLQLIDPIFDAVAAEPMIISDAVLARARLPSRAYPMFRQRAFLLSLHFTAPHWPWEGPDDEAESKRIRNIFHRDGGTQKTYAAMVQSLDSNIGRVLQTLDVRALSANTIVIFTSDNGGERFSKIWPFTGMKGELLEGGLRIPAIARWPGRVPAGVLSEQVVISMDWMPTLLAAAGTEMDPSYPPDGDNLLPVLTGRASPHPRKWRFKSGGRGDRLVLPEQHTRRLCIPQTQILVFGSDRLVALAPNWPLKVDGPCHPRSSCVLGLEVGHASGSNSVRAGDCPVCGGLWRHSLTKSLPSGTGARATSGNTH